MTQGFDEGVYVHKQCRRGVRTMVLDIISFKGFLCHGCLLYHVL